MLANDALHGDQAYARAFKFIRAVQPLKNSKQLVNVFHAEADAVVSHHENRLPVFFFVTDFDDGAGAGASELEGVGQQVLKHLLDQNRIAFDLG